MMAQRIAILAASALITAGALAQQPFGFKGVPLGASEKQLLARHPAFICADGDGVNADRECRAYDGACAYRDQACVDSLFVILSYGGVTVRSVTVSLYDDRVARVMVSAPSYSFEQMRDAVGEALGRPDRIEHPILTNAFGARTQNEVAIWERRRGAHIRVHRYASNLDTAYVYIAAQWVPAVFAQRSKAKGKAGAKDL